MKWWLHCIWLLLAISAFGHTTRDVPPLGSNQTVAFTVNSLNQLTTATRSGSATVAGMTSMPATNVLVNTVSATLYADNTFARQRSLDPGSNTLTAVAWDNLGRIDTNTITVFVPTTATFAYDLNGNLLSDGRRGFQYDEENQLTRVSVTNAWKSEFSYDAFGRRRIRQEFTWQAGDWLPTDEVRYVYEGNLVIQERWHNPQVSLSVPQRVIYYTRGNDLSGRREGAGGIGGLLARTDASDLNNYSSAFYHSEVTAT